MVRINKYLSLCGVTSRRGAEALISAGKVTVNDLTVEALGTIIDETKDVVKVDGTIVQPATENYYILLNKSRNVMTTLHDPFKRKTIADLLKDFPHRVYPIGRLDYDTQGVLLLTNDGELAFRLAHPKYQIIRMYEARVKGFFEEESAKKIAAGIKLDDGAIGKALVRVIHYGKEWTRIELELREGRKREVKQLCRKVGHPVTRLTRTLFAGVSTSDLRTGKWRHLRISEVNSLKDLVGITYK